MGGTDQTGDGRRIKRITWWSSSWLPQVLKAIFWAVLTATVLCLVLRNRGFPDEVVVFVPLAVGLAVYIWFWVANRGKRPAFAVGGYKLDDAVPSVELREFSESEYQLFGREFKHEKNFHAPRVDFLGYSWNLLLGTVSGRIYKIHPYMLFSTKGYAGIAATATFQYCTEQLGRPSSHTSGESWWWWTKDGNVILQGGETAEGFSVGLFLTSDAVNRFERLPKAKNS